MPNRVRRAGATGSPAEPHRRRRPSRRLPKWLLHVEPAERVAKARCLMLLRVLSGAQPVTEAIAAARISRPTYYQLETRALQAMLRALQPRTAGTAARDGERPPRRLAALEAKIRSLEQARRRAERLLSLTRRVMRARPGSMTRGTTALPRSARTTTAAAARRPSSPTASGEGEA